MYKTDFFQHIGVILECSFEHFIRCRKKCGFDGSNPLVSTSFSWVRSCLLVRNFITWTFVTSQLPALLCLVPLVTETLWWPRLWWRLRDQSWQLLPSLSPRSVSGLLCTSSWMSAQGLCHLWLHWKGWISLLCFEILRVLCRHGKKKAVPYQKKWQDMTHLK